ncbi:MAG: surface lipoprotein assembly modifier [Pseudomonadota bacterium]
MTRRLAIISIIVAACCSTLHAKANPAWETSVSRYDRISVGELQQTWHSLPAESKMTALFQLVAQGEFEAAQAFLDRSKFGGGAALDATYIQGLVYKNTDQFDAAAERFRQILVNHPDNQPARIQLAHTLFLMKEDESARHHFQLALGSVTNRDLENNIRNFIDQLDRRKRWHLGAHISIAPSTNFNQGADDGIIYLNGLPFQITDEGTKKSGIGLNGGFNAGYRFAVTDRLDFVTGAGVHFKEYDGETYDDHAISAQIGPRYTDTLGHVGLYATYNRRWFAHTPYSTGIGGRAQLTAQLSNRALLSASVGCSWNTHDEAEHYDGRSCFAAGYIDQHLSSTMYARLLAGSNTSLTSREHLDHAGWYGGLGLYTELAWGTSIYGEIRYTKRDFDGAFPGSFEPRDDKQFDVTGTLTKRDWNYMGFAPQFEYGYTRNVSNVPFYDYDAHSVNMTLTKNF